MKRPVRGSPSRRRHLSDEDEALWTSTASTVEPLKRKGRVHESIDPETLAAAPSNSDGRTNSRGKPAGTQAQHLAGRAHAHHIAEPVAKPGHLPVPPLADFDKRRARKIRSGQQKIERRIDLHGMTQSEAHALLRSFLLGCHAEGRRTVLVITGKGAPRRRRDDALDGWSDREPGVLKRQVPRWLAEPELRAIVVSYTMAAAQHGGEGALYVHLRRPRGD